MWVHTHTEALLNPSALSSLGNQLLVMLKFSHLFHHYEPTPVGTRQEGRKKGSRYLQQEGWNLFLIPFVIIQPAIKPLSHSNPVLVVAQPLFKP